MNFINSMLKAEDFAKEYQDKYPDHYRFRGERFMNANGDIAQTSLGFQYAIDTLTYIRKQTVDQKFYEIDFAEIIPTAVGEATFYQNITTNLVMNAFGDFDNGDLNEGSANTRLSGVDVGVSSFTQVIKNWAIATSYTLIEVQQALASGNWDVVEKRQKARKKMWDLGLQKIAFLGHAKDTRIMGIYNQSTVNSNTAVITKAIGGMTYSEFSAFVAAFYQAYRANSNYTSRPTHWLMPESTFNGLMVPVSSQYPSGGSMIEWLEKALAVLNGKPIKIIPLIYGQAAFNGTLTSNERHVLFNSNEDSILLDIPCDLTVTNPNSVNNFQFEDAGYGQYSGVQVYRPLEILYFDW